MWDVAAAMRVKELTSHASRLQTWDSILQMLNFAFRRVDSVHSCLETRNNTKLTPMSHMNNWNVNKLVKVHEFEKHLGGKLTLM